MKDIITFITEAANGEIEFQGQKFQLNQIIKTNVHNDIYQATRVKEFTEDMWKDLKKQGCTHFICFPPHYTKPGNEKVDEFQIKMFIKGKKMSDTYKGGELYAIYDTKTHECINKDIMEKGKAYKVIRFE